MNLTILYFYLDRILNVVTLLNLVVLIIFTVLLNNKIMLFLAKVTTFEVKSNL